MMVLRCSAARSVVFSPDGRPAGLRRTTADELEESCERTFIATSFRPARAAGPEPSTRSCCGLGAGICLEPTYPQMINVAGYAAVMEEWPLRGRDTLLARAVDALRVGRGVVLVGAAGVGKSRLARAVVDEIEPAACPRGHLPRGRSGLPPVRQLRSL